MAREQGSDPLKEAAMDLFSENGVDGTSLRMIADKVGVTKGAIYHYFPSKDELHASIHLSRIDAALEELEQVTSSEVSNREKVRRVIWIMLNSIATHHDDPQSVAFALIGMCNWSYIWIGVHSETPVEKVADLFSSIFLEGIVAKPSAVRA